MNRVLGIIITGGRKESMGELTMKRSVAAIPVGGKFRAIDFVLSSMVNSGINKVGVVTQYSFRSLTDHLGSGKEWDLDRRHDGLFMFHPYLEGEGSGWYKGSADGLHNNISFLQRSKEEYVVLTMGNCIFTMDFKDLVESHIASDADLTVMYRDMSDLGAEDLKSFGMIELDANNKITNFQEKPLDPQGTLASTGVYILKRTLLIKLLVESYSMGRHDFVKGVVIHNLDNINVKGYEFKGYWRSMNSIQAFYKCNIEMIEPEVKKELFDTKGRVFTKVKDETPAKYNEEAHVRHSIISDGCIIEGEVYNSVLARGVKIGKGCIVKDSVIMQDTVLEEGSKIEYVILDKNVTIDAGKSLKGEEHYPVVVGKGAFVK